MVAPTTGYIYGLTTRTDRTIRYIGQLTSTTPRLCVQRHVREALHSEHRTPVRNWVRRRVNAEIRIDIMLLKEAPLADLDDLEAGFIKLLRSSTSDLILLNMQKERFDETQAFWRE